MPSVLLANPKDCLPPEQFTPRASLKGCFVSGGTIVTPALAIARLRSEGKWPRCPDDWPVEDASADFHVVAAFAEIEEPTEFQALFAAYLRQDTESCLAFERQLAPCSVSNPEQPKKTQQDVPELIDIGKAAIKVDMSKRWITERIKDGTLVGYKLGNRVAVTVESLGALIRNSRMKPVRVAVTEL
jgi:hypothetical protein